SETPMFQSIPLNAKLLDNIRPPALKPLAGDDFVSEGKPRFQAEFESLRSVSRQDLSATAQTSSDQHFSDLTPIAGAAGFDLDPETQHRQIVEQAEKWVAQTFYGTMLKQIRNSPFKSELFAGGRGG